MNRQSGLRAVSVSLVCLLTAILVAALLGIIPSLLSQDYINASGGSSIARTFQPSSADSWLNETSKNVNYGTGLYIEAKSNGKDGRGLVQFDISEIPTGSTVTSATLSLYISFKGTNWTGATTRTYDVHQVTTSWAEATVSWRVSDGGNWGTAGGDFNATPTASQPTTGTGTGVWMDWTVTSDVSAFVGGTANYGWIVKDDTEGSATLYDIQFHSSEYTTDLNLRPKLAVTFTADTWDSHTDIARGAPPEEDFADPDTTVYMRGTGFPTATNYNVFYYDNDGYGWGTDSNIAATGGTLDSLYVLTTYTDATAGLWHALVQPSTGYTGFDTSYTTVVNNPDTYGLIANDNFNVQASAIPEFPTILAAIVVAGLCFGIYYWMRKRKLAYVKA